MLINAELNVVQVWSYSVEWDLVVHTVQHHSPIYNSRFPGYNQWVHSPQPDGMYDSYEVSHLGMHIAHCTLNIHQSNLSTEKTMKSTNSIRFRPLFYTDISPRSMTFCNSEIGLQQLGPSSAFCRLFRYLVGNICKSHNLGTLSAWGDPTFLWWTHLLPTWGED